MDKWIDEKLDKFFDKKGADYINMDIFKQIFVKLETPEYENKNPELYQYELKRIRDLHNSFEFAFEEGFKKGSLEAGKIEEKIEIAKEMLKEKEPVLKIIKYTGLTEKEINELKE